MSDLTVTTENAIATVTLNRPAKKNALTLDLLDALITTGETLAADDSLRAVILTGAGDCFSAGIDTSALQHFATRIEEVRQTMATPLPGGCGNAFQKPCLIWTSLRVPVIAALHGVTYGAGLQLALGADIRIAHPDTRLSILEAKWGLIPDMGITQTLPRLMRADIAKELIMTGRVLSASEAQAHGLITHIDADPLTAARTLASEIATRSPDAVAATKTLVDQTWGPDPATALALEGQLQSQLIGAHNQMEMVMANLQKRPPRFTPQT